MTRSHLAIALVVLAAVLMLVPLLWVLALSLKANSELMTDTASVFNGRFTLDNYRNLFGNGNVFRWIGNSLIVSLGMTAGVLVLTSLAGYGFEMFKSKWRDRIYSLVLLTLMVPFAALMIPLFIMMGKAGLINTHLAVVLPSIGSAFIVFYFRQCTKAFPSELRDAAKVDGLKEWQIFLFIYVPVMRSTYAAAFIIVFMTAWNNYLWPLIVLQSNETKTITLVVSSLASAYYPDYGVVMVGTILATLPTLAVFFFMQRQFVQGMLGSVK